MLKINLIATTILLGQTAALSWFNLKRSPRAPSYDYDTAHPFEQGPQDLTGLTHLEFLTTQDVCDNMGVFGSNICFICSCLDWQGDNPQHCDRSITLNDLLSCLRRLSSEGGAHYGFMIAQSTLTTRSGCHGYGISDKEIQYHNPYFREKIYSAWFKSPVGLALFEEVMPSKMEGLINITWHKQRQVCDSRNTDKWSASARVGFRPNTDESAPLGRDPHQACVLESPIYATTAEFGVSPTFSWTVAAKIPLQPFSDAAAWLGPEDWFAVDLAVPHPCPASQTELEPFMSGSVYSASLTIAYPVMWLNPFHPDFWYSCCAMPPSPSQSGAILDQSSNGVYTHQWVKEGGILRGIDPAVCRYLRGRVIEGTAECLSITPGTYSPLTVLVEYDWQ